MRLLVGHDPIVAQWVGERLGGHFIAPFTALGIINGDGVLRGGCVIRARNSDTCEVSLYSENAMTPGIMRGICRMLFDGLGFARCEIHTPRDNKAMKRAAPKLGFRFECRAWSFYGNGRDALQFSMTRNSCRWLRTTS